MHEHTPQTRLLEAREQLLSYVRQRVADPELAEDILQDALLRAVQAMPNLRDEERLIPWFYTILRNAIVDAYRRRAGERKQLAEVEVESLDRPAEEADETVLCECFRELIPTLKPEYAELIEALELRAERPEAAARRLGITPNNLKVRRHRARQALRKRLDETCRTCAEHGCLDCTCGRAV